MLTDDGLLRAAALAGLDGPELETTKELARKLGANGIDTNRWWIVTPAGWSCPGCGRNKAEFARLNTKGAMMGHIVLHHDHMADVVVGAFHRTSGARSQVVADELSEAFVKRTAAAMSAYDPVLVCIDCNNADARAKRDVPTDKGFSFSAQDIKQFVVPRPNSDHEIMLDVARNLWNSYCQTFQVRLDLIERIAAIGAAAEDWYQGHTPHTANPAMVEAGAGVRLALQLGLPSEIGLRERFIELQKTRRPQNIDLSKWRVIPPKPNISPRQGEIDHVARVTHIGHWRAVPDDWCCPACSRTKAETVRPSSKFAWAFEIQESMIFDPQTAGPARVWICGDCRNTRVSLATEAGVLSELVSIDDLRAIIQPHPHQRHAIANTAINQVLEKLRQRDNERVEWDWG